MDYNIKHHGAVNGVTGSCHELCIDEKNSILIDCGLFQGAETSPDGSSQDHLSIDFSIHNIQALVVSHVHIDHVGRIPYLLAAGFKGPIFCTRPSALLLPEVLQDAVKIGFTKNRRLVVKFIDHIKTMIIPLDYDKSHSVSLSNTEFLLNIQLKPAGHILGSAYVECEIIIPSTIINQRRINQRRINQGRISETMASEKTVSETVADKKTGTNQTGAKKKKVVFSGDLGAPYAPLLPAPKSPYGCDVLVIESTYGDKIHASRKNRSMQLKKIIERAFEDRGVVLIPAFSIGRTQELLYELENIIHIHKQHCVARQIPWDDIEIIVDSPLANEFTKKYKLLSKYWDAEASDRLKRGRHPLDFSQLITINHHQEHLQTVEYLKKTARPAVVISASGMCTSGRIVNYLTALIGDSRTDILFTGYQAHGTSGRIIQKYGQGGYVMLEGKKYSIAANVHTISGYSAHADQQNLFNFVKRMRSKPNQIRLVHGDNEAKQALQRIFRENYPEIEVIIPNN
jgi:metallo-beta-lactamase family protein